ncbi:MAG TPA: hypothetical protein V6D17_13455 [Candidatus Obscuribacterales bacterium]
MIPTRSGQLTPYSTGACAQNDSETSADNSERVEDLMNRYNDLPMDFADAVTVAIAEDMQVKTVFTLDRRDFLVYRSNHVKQLKILPD